MSNRAALWISEPKKLSSGYRYIAKALDGSGWEKPWISDHIMTLPEQIAKVKQLRRGITTNFTEYDKPNSELSNSEWRQREIERDPELRFDYEWLNTSTSELRARDKYSD